MKKKEKYLLTLSISSFIIELKKYVIYTWREIVRFCFILNIQLLLVLNAKVRHQPIHCHIISCLHQEYIHTIYIHVQQCSQASYLISSCFISQALSRPGQSWHLRLFITLLLKKSGLVQGSLSANKVGFSCGPEAQIWKTYSMRIHGAKWSSSSSENKQPIGGGSQYSPVFPEVREPRISLPQTLTSKRTTRGMMDKTTGQGASGQVLCSHWCEHHSFSVVLPTGGICILRVLIPWHEANSKHYYSPFVICLRKMVWFVCL